MRTVDPEHPLAAEIQQEMAASYLAACRKMVEALAALRGFDAAGHRSQRHTARRTELLADAAERVYCVVVQREALQLSGYEEFFRQYDVPAEVRARMGTKPQRSSRGD
jgi:hypothetical protein